MEAINDNVATGLRQGRVHFYDGGRTRWHLHVGDQVLYFLSGHGMVEKLGGTLIETVAGDIVHIPGGLQHRHGAQAGKSATHIAITQGETIWDNDPRYPV